MELARTDKAKQMTTKLAARHQAAGELSDLTQQLPKQRDFDLL